LVHSDADFPQHRRGCKRHERGQYFDFAGVELRWMLDAGRHRAFHLPWLESRHVNPRLCH
jgi:hypothetical protein